MFAVSRCEREHTALAVAAVGVVFDATRQVTSRVAWRRLALAARHACAHLRGVMLRAIAELAGLVRPSGDGLLFGLDHDLGQVATLEQGWQCLCETAWALGLVELQLDPDPAPRHGLPQLHAAVPGQGAASSSWSFELSLVGRRAAVMTARRGGNCLEFDSGRFVAAVEALIARFAEPGAPG
jgi:hypothetical protein